MSEEHDEDLERLFEFRQLLDRLRSEPNPKAFLWSPSGEFRPGRMGVLPGSFNPPTLAHVELARQARGAFNLDTIVFSVGSLIVDKQTATGLCLEDRLLLLSMLTQELGWGFVAAVNKGLYYEQAAAYRELAGRRAHLFFIVGMDKVLQIFDAKYYEDRDSALRSLFIDSQLIAAQRGDANRQTLEKLLALKENRAYEDRVFFLSLPPEVRDLSSSSIREGIASNATLAEELPPLVRAFIADTGAYRTDYEIRRVLLDRLFPLRDWVREKPGAHRLLALAQQASERGARLRKILLDQDLGPAKLREQLQHELGTDQGTGHTPLTSGGDGE